MNRLFETFEAGHIKYHNRLKQEHAELVEALAWVVGQVDRFGGITIENNHSTFEKFRKLIAKVEK